MLSLNELMAYFPGASLLGDGEARFDSVSTDTRTLRAGALYFALRGDRFDGHDFTAEALERGAAALVVERPIEPSLPQVLVADTRRALGFAAAGWRSRFHPPLIAVTGSNGKTTVTQMIAAILAAAHGEAHRLATRGNLNNDIGLPLMLFEMQSHHRAAVLELGMNHPGEIEYLAELARPTVALVNNAQREHQEFLQGVEATAHENGAVITALPPDGIAVFPADDDCAPIWRALAGDRRVFDFGLSGPAAITATWTEAADASILAIDTPVGPIALRLPLAGIHNIRNALAAVAASLAVDIAPDAIQRGLEAFTPVAGRGVQARTLAGALVIDDSYNANPDSVRAAIDLLAGRPGTRVLILGDMGEVGVEGPAFHREVGCYAAERHIDALLCLGELCRHSAEAFRDSGGAEGHHYQTLDALLAAARDWNRTGATLLVKGSRFMRMERVVQALLGPE